MDVFTNLINKRNLPVNITYGQLSPLITVGIIFLVYLVLYNKNVKNYLNTHNRQSKQ